MQCIFIITHCTTDWKLLLNLTQQASCCTDYFKTRSLINTLISRLNRISAWTVVQYSHSVCFCLQMLLTHSASKIRKILHICLAPFLIAIVKPGFMGWYSFQLEHFGDCSKIRERSINKHQRCSVPLVAIAYYAYSNNNTLQLSRLLFLKGGTNNWYDESSCFLT